jgi:hypothetical protein
VAAVFAGGAALFAYQTIASQRKQIDEQRTFIGEQSATLELERAELRAAAEDRRLAQARQVRMNDHTAAVGTDSEGNPLDDDHRIVNIFNDSDAAIHEVEVRFGTAYTAADVWELASSNHSYSMRRGDRLMTPVQLLGPRRGAQFVSGSFPPAPLYNNRPSVTFTDDGGVRWRLDHRGKLDEVPPEPGA